jgi:NAD(P)-dependent dehydrogenase (short-subunit alcohol dehydrogenase family)
MADAGRTALVTGASEGLGLEVCRQLSGAGWNVILTALDRDLGTAEAASLGAMFRPLDVTSAQQILSLVDELRHDGLRIDLLVNNAGVSLRGFNEQVVRQTLAVNFYGAMTVTDALLPLMPDRAHVVMVSSGLGELQIYPPPIQAQFADPQLTRERLVSLLEQFAEDVGALGHAPEGWPSSAYRVSKTGLIALAKVFARELAPRGIRVHAVCPGWVRTRMGGQSALRTVEEGARLVVLAATSDLESGGYYRDGKPAHW